MITTILALCLLTTSTLSVFATPNTEEDKKDTDDKPWISIVDVQGGFGVTITVKNIGQVKGEEIPWTLSFSEGSAERVIVGERKTGTLSIAAGETQSIKTGFIFGFGTATMTIQVAGKTYGPENVLILGPLVIGA